MFNFLPGWEMWDCHLTNENGVNEMWGGSANVCKAFGEQLSDELKASSKAKWEPVVWAWERGHYDDDEKVKGEQVENEKVE